MRLSKQLLLLLSLFTTSIFAGALHEAVRAKDTDKVKQLLEIGVVKVDDFDRYNMAPLHYAVIAKSEQMIKLLSGAGANMNVQDKFEGVRTEGGFWFLPDIESYPLQYKSSILQTHRYPLEGDRFLNTPLHLAVIMDEPRLVKLLVAEGADVNALGSGKAPALHYRHISQSMAKLLLEQGVDKNIRDGKGRTALHNPRISQSVAEVLLENKADPSIEDEKKRTALHNPGISTDRVKLLLRYKAKTSVRDVKGITPLHIHTSNGHSDITKLLVGAGAKLDAQDLKGHTPLRYLVDMYVLLKAKEFAKTRPRESDYIEVTKNYGVGARFGGRGGPTGGTSQRLRIVDYSVALTSYYRGLGIFKIGKKWDKLKLKRLAKLLLEKGANPNLGDNANVAPLHIASASSPVMTEVLLKAKGINVSQPAPGGTPLHYAAGNLRDKNVRLLLQAGAKLEATDEDGDRPLALAFIMVVGPPDQRRFEQQLESLMENKEELGNPFQEDRRRKRARISIEMAKGFYHVVRTLLNKGADPFAKGIGNNTALHQAAASEIPLVVKLLIESEAFKKDPKKINVKNDEGKTAFDIATKGRQKVKDSIEAWRTSKRTDEYISLVERKNWLVEMINLLEDYGGKPGA